MQHSFRALTGRISCTACVTLFFLFYFFLSLQRLWATIRVFVALWIGAVILVCNYGSWYSDSICTRTQYMAHTGVNSPQLIEARVELSIGLRGINITLLETECEHLLLSICICMLLVYVMCPAYVCNLYSLLQALA